MTVRLFAVPIVCLCLGATAWAQNAPAAADSSATGAPEPAAAAAPERVAATAPAPVPAAADVTRIDPALEFQIGPEDVLDISVWKVPEVSRTVPVRPDGKVSLPLINDIQASGLTTTELRQQLTTRLSEFFPSPEVSVIVREVHSRKVAVVGAVKTPGRFELKSAATVLEAIALAQGFTDFASRDRIVVLRQNGGTTNRIPFNYRKVADGSDQDNFILRPGDIVVVP